LQDETGIEIQEKLLLRFFKLNAGRQKINFALNNYRLNIRTVCLETPVDGLFNCL
jgi:hypothetical protein